MQMQETLLLQVQEVLALMHLLCSYCDCLWFPTIRVQCNYKDRDLWLSSVAKQLSKMIWCPFLFPCDLVKDILKGGCPQGA